MKKLSVFFFVLCTVLLLASCKTATRVSSKTAYLETIGNIQNSMRDMGYSLQDQNTDAAYWTNKEFLFNDDEGNNASFTLKYNDKGDYVTKVEITNCAANKNYDEICGSNGVVKTQIDSLNNNPDKVVEELNIIKTVAAGVGGTIGLIGLIVLISVLIFI